MLALIGLLHPVTDTWLVEFIMLFCCVLNETNLLAFGEHMGLFIGVCCMLGGLVM